MKVEPNIKTEKFPKVFRAIKDVSEQDLSDTWLRRQIKWWVNFESKTINWKAKSIRKLYQKPHFEVTLTNGKKILFIIYQKVN